MYDFYYGLEAEQFAFYRIPKLLFEAEPIKDISTDAKLLYGMMLDRMQLSVRNGWTDELGRVYIYYSVRQIMTALRCGNKKVSKLLYELESVAGLIERHKYGMSKPDRIYLKNFLSVVSKGHQWKCQKDINGDVEMTSIEVSKGHTNNTDISDTDKNNTESILSIRSEDGMEKYLELKNLVKNQIEYELLIQDRPEEEELLQEILLLITDVLFSNGGAVRISGDEKPIEVVKGMFLRLEKCHIEYVLQGMKENPVKVRNMKGYLLASLYNAPMTINSYYSALVNHDITNGLV